MTNQPKQRNVKNALSADPTCIVPTVTKECQQVETEEESTVTRHVHKRLTENGNVSPTNTKPNKQRNATVKNCEHCDAEFQTTRPKQSKYCNAVCRRNAWLVRNPDKAKALALSDRARLKQWYIDNNMEWKDEL